MKSQIRHKDLLARQSENTPFSTGDNEKVSCLGLHISVYEFMLRSYCDHTPSVVRCRPASVRSPASVCSHFQTTSPLKPPACTGGTKNCYKLLARVIPLVAMATRYQILKNLLLQDRSSDSKKNS